MTQPPDKKAIACSVIERLAEATCVPFVSVQLGDGAWVPQEHYCQANVETWVQHNSQHKDVRGFLISETSPGEWVLFNHAVVEREDGTLMDITPMKGKRPPFIRHIGTCEEFGIMQGEKGNTVSTKDCR